MPEFEREGRYVVLKITDLIDALDADEKEAFIHIEHRIEAHRASLGKRPMQCVVVEHDWPEYEVVWDMIKQRVLSGCS